MIILKILAMWTVASFALALVIGPFLKRMRREQTIRLPPLPEGSILGKHSERELSR